MGLSSISWTGYGSSWPTSARRRTRCIRSKVRDASDEGGSVVLGRWNGSLPLPASELVDHCPQHGSLADLRDALDSTSLVFNKALARVDPPHTSSRPPGPPRAGDGPVHRDPPGAILNSSSRSVSPSGVGTGDLTSYGEARTLEGLEPDPAWLDLYAEPPENLLAREVGTWLAGHGASTDLDASNCHAEVTSLRTATSAASTR